MTHKHLNPGSKILDIEDYYDCVTCITRIAKYGIDSSTDPATLRPPAPPEPTQTRTPVILLALGLAFIFAAFAMLGLACWASSSTTTARFVGTAFLALIPGIILCIVAAFADDGDDDDSPPRPQRYY